MKTIDGSSLATRLIALQRAEGNEALVLREMARSGRLWRILPTLETPRFIADSESGGAMAFVIVARDDGARLGFVTVSTFADAPGRGRLGPIWTSSEANAPAIARDATFLLMRFGFETAGYQRFELVTEPHDRNSGEQLRRYGFRREGVLRSFDRGPEGELGDIAIWSMVLAEWPRAKRRLEAAIAAATWPGHASLPTIMPP